MIVTDACRGAVDAAALCARWMAGQVGERPVSDQQRADERCCSVRRSRVVLTPRRWRQVRGVASAQPGLDKTYPLMTVAKEPDRRGARRKPLKPLRAGTSGDSGVLVYSCAFLPMQSAHEAAGATGTRRSPRPLWAEDLSTARAHGAARTYTCVWNFRHCERSEAIDKAAKKEWIASLRSQ